MLNKQHHRLIMGRILKDIYSDISIAPLVGLKGGTCAYFFYNLPRFSVDLDFDALVPNQDNNQVVLTKIGNILKPYGVIKDRHIKRNTIFMVLSYGEEDHNIKIEISIRQTPFSPKDHYEVKEHLGISLLAATPDYLFAGKLAALALRKVTAMRDIYDVHFFAKNNFDFNSEVLTALTHQDTKKTLADCLKIIANIPDNQILQGLGELLDPQEKQWVKENLKSDTIFMLKNYRAAL